MRLQKVLRGSSETLGPQHGAICHGLSQRRRLRLWRRRAIAAVLIAMACAHWRALPIGRGFLVPTPRGEKHQAAREADDGDFGSGKQLASHAHGITLGPACKTSKRRRAVVPFDPRCRVGTDAVSNRQIV